MVRVTLHLGYFIILNDGEEGERDAVLQIGADQNTVCTAEGARKISQPTYNYPLEY